LMIKSLATLNHVDLGFDPSNILTANLTLPERRYPTPEARLQFFELLAPRVAALPGVRAVTFANRLPLTGAWSSGFAFEPHDVPAGSRAQATAGFQAVSAGYFPIFGLSAIRGRVLNESDREGRAPVAVVNEEFSRAFLQGADPIGRSFRRHDKAPWIRIVGIVPDIRRDGRTARIVPQVYLSAAQTSLYPPHLSVLAVHVDARPETFAGPIRAAVWSIDRDQPVARVRTLERTLSLGQADRNFQTLLFSLFAGLALTLAVVGIYGVVAYAVNQRTAEIGLRLALGADPGKIVRWIIGQSLRLVVVGAVIGLGAAFWLTRSIRALLFETSPADPASYAAAAGMLTLAAVTACYVAARRATRVDPATVLK
jgi:putative ABC transport system permease protein